MSHPLLRAAACLLASLSLAVPTTAGDVLVVNALGGGDFLDVGAAIVAAQDGDIILVQLSAPYPPFTVDDKTLSIMVEQVGQERAGVLGGITIRNLSPQRHVELSGFHAMGGMGSGDSPGLVLEQNAGSVRVQACTLEGADNLECSDWNGFGSGRPGVVMTGCDDVSFLRCVMTGGDGMGGSLGDDCYIGGRGGDGMLLQQSRVVVFESQTTGGRGGDAASVGLGGDGGSGLVVVDQRVFVTRTLATGGAGGIGNESTPITGFGNGGDGFTSSPSAQTRLLETEFVGGAAGFSAFNTPGDPGQSTTPGGGPFIEFTAASQHLTLITPPIVREFQLIDFRFTGAPGDVVSMMLHAKPGQLGVDSLAGTLLLGFPVALGPALLFAIPASGMLKVPIPVGELGPGVDGVVIHFQALWAEAQGLRIGSANLFTVLDESI